MATSIGDHPSTFFRGLSDFWLRFFRDTADLEAFYQASEIYLGDMYLDLLSSVLNIGLIDTPIFNKEYWKLFAIREDELSFVEGITSDDDRFAYDMPGAIVHAETLQNTIFEPDIVLENDVDFESLNNDGLIRFKENIFRAYTDSDGNVLPLSGVAWRYTTLETGNRFTDKRRVVSWYDDSDVKQGDTLRILGYKGNLISGPHVGDGTITYTGSDTRFTSATTLFGPDNIGDVIRILNSTDVFNGHYVIKKVVPSPTSNTVILEPTEYVPTSSTLPFVLEWEFYKGMWLDVASDHRVDYIDDTYLVGDVSDPYPLEYDAEIISAIVRDVPTPDIIGIILNSSPILASGSALTEQITPDGNFIKITVTGSPFVSGMARVNLPAGSTVEDYYWVSIGNEEYKGSYYIEEYIDANNVRLGIAADDIGLTGTVTNIEWKLSKTPPRTFLGNRHIVRGTFVPHARRVFGGALIEGIDYQIDYFRGYFNALKPFDPDVVHTCSYQYQKEVSLSSDGHISEYTEGRVKQMSFWVPEVWRDKFNLYYNYGSLFNRFEASSENYKAFLRGILYLYVTGPIMQRIEAALNVAADYPVIRSDGEILTAYDNGRDDENTDGQLVDAFTDPLRPYDHFITPSHTFTEIDVGGYIVIPDALNEKNRGRFRILNVIATDTVEIETAYGVVNESPLDWVLTRYYRKRVTTDKRFYDFPYNVPIREDIEDPDSIGYLTFVAFEPLTEAFTVTDYYEDPNWWHNKTIPDLFWPNETRQRRLASTQLYEHIVGPVDDARMGDPGLYVGSDDSGVIAVSGAPLRHCAAFIIFDRYLKFHMFYIQFSADLGLDQEFITDLEELILVVKPSYTYPFVEPSELLEDTLLLFEEYFQQSFSFNFGDEEELEISDNNLIVGGSPERFMSMGDYFRYVDYDDIPSGVASPPGGPFNLPIAGIPPAKQHVVKLRLDATVGGIPVEEGRDFTFDYDPTAPSPWLVTPRTTWDAAVSVNFDALVIEIVNLADVPTPDTTVGFTPLTVGGTDPGFVRKTIVPPTYPLPTDYFNKMEKIDRTASLFVEDGGLPYTYP